MYENLDVNKQLISLTQVNVYRECEWGIKPLVYIQDFTVMKIDNWIEPHETTDALFISRSNRRIRIGLIRWKNSHGKDTVIESQNRFFYLTIGSFRSNFRKALLDSTSRNGIVLTDCVTP